MLLITVVTLISFSGLFQTNNSVETYSLMKCSIVLFLIPFWAIAQEPDNAQLYLSLKNQLTTHPNDLKCVLDPKLSKSYVRTYDCYNIQNRLTKQLNRKPRLYGDTFSSITRPYLKNMPNSITDTYLIGDMKDSKPFNGFFMYPGTNIWLIFDFYLNGKRLFQVYGDLLAASMVEDTETSFTALTEKNIFVNGRLKSGIDVTPVRIKKGIVDIVRKVNNFKTTGFILTLFGKHSPEYIEIRPTAQGYELMCIGKNGVKVIYHPAGKKFVFYDWEGKVTAKPKRLNSDHYSITLEKLASALAYHSVDAEALKTFVKERW